MLYVSTLFDLQRDSRPLFTATYDTITKSVQFFPLYLPKTGKTIYEIEQNKQAVAQIIHGQHEVCLNDYKQHLIGFDLDSLNIDCVYDYPCLMRTTLDLVELKKTLLKQVKSMQAMGRQKWAHIRGNAAPVYKQLQQRGVYFGYDKVHPIWHMDVYSGRTRTEGFNIQGLQDDDPIASVNGHDTFVCLDWVAADFRMASIMSGDQKLAGSFDVSDPYEFMASAKNDPEVTRSSVKGELFKSLYSMDCWSNGMLFYKGLGQWMQQKREQIEATGKMESILDRVFEVSDERSILSAFNAGIQGSIAHAMQRVIRGAWEICPMNLLIENHDSLILTFKKTDKCRHIISDVADIMCHPFRGILEADPIFPVVVSIGSKYKLWRKFKRYDG